MLLNRDSASYRRERAEYFNTPRRAGFPPKQDGKEVAMDRDIRRRRPKSIARARASSGIPSKLYSWINTKRARVKIRSFRKCSRFNSDRRDSNKVANLQDFYLFVTEKCIIIDLRIYLRICNILLISKNYENREFAAATYFIVLCLIERKRKRMLAQSAKYQLSL